MRLDDLPLWAYLVIWLLASIPPAIIIGKAIKWGQASPDHRPTRQIGTPGDDKGS